MENPRKEIMNIDNNWGLPIPSHMAPPIFSKLSAFNNFNNWGLPIPSHIAPLIFSKLSVLDLPVCRCVCKSWNHLVLDYAHHSLSKFQLPNYIILSTCDLIPHNSFDFLNTKIHCFDINTLSFVASRTIVEPYIRLLSTLNCCNGLLYIRKFYKPDKTYICDSIFNPITHQFFQIPAFSEPPDGLYKGFGFSTKTKQYKIFLAYPKTTCELKILRLGSNPDHNQWTSIYLPSPVSIRSHGVYMDGVIYWIGIEVNNRNVSNIYALDVETEKIESVMVLEVPYSYPGNLYSYSDKLQLFNGTIYAIISITEPICQIQLWKMQSKHSWIKDFIILGKYKKLDLQLLKAFEDGKILVRLKNSLLMLTYGKKIETKDNIKRLIPRNRQFTDNCICPLDSLHFDSIPNILGTG